MGLDGVEIVMEVEERFGISIADDEASKAETVGQLASLVTSKLPPADTVACHTARVFYRLRRDLIGRIGVARADVRPEAETLTLLRRGTTDTRTAWRATEAAVGLQLPPLELPRPLFYALVATWLSVPASLIWLAAGTGGWPVRLLLSAASVVLAVLATIGTRPWETIVPVGSRTFGGFVESIARRNVGRLIGETRAWTEEDVLGAIREIVAEHMRLDPAKVTRDARFVQDLGVS